MHLVDYQSIQKEYSYSELKVHFINDSIIGSGYVYLTQDYTTHTHTLTDHTVELKIRQAKAKIENVPLGGGPDEQENDFWEKLMDKLKPETVRFTPIDDLKANLKSLRNSVLAILLLVNLMWIILLYTLEFSQLIDYGLESRAFQTLFLAVYGIIIVIQFVTLLCHRSVTLVHYLGRTQPDEIVGHENREALVVTLARDYIV